MKRALPVGVRGCRSTTRALWRRQGLFGLPYLVQKKEGPGGCSDLASEVELTDADAAPTAAEEPQKQRLPSLTEAEVCSCPTIGTISHAWDSKQGSPKGPGSFVPITKDGR